MRIWIHLAGVCGALALTVMPARAAEQITLRNGFQIICHHHGVANRKVRLYTGKTNESFIEVEPADIVLLEHVPDPAPPDPPAAPVSAPAVAAAPSLTPAPVALQIPKIEAKAVPAVLNQQDLNEMLAKAGKQHNVDRDLLASVVKAESNGNVRAVSRAGAQGLMQLMPGTAADLGVSDTFKPDQNVQGGSTYLDELLTRYHDNLAMALAAYNAGPAAVDKYHGIPPYRETRLYVARVIHEFNRRVQAREAEARKALAASASVPKPAGN